MSRRAPGPLRRLLAGLLATGWVASTPAPAAAQAAKPDIVLILTDDQEESLVEHMPNVLALIRARGARFERAFYNVPLCCPSRATMLTGMYVQNTGVDHNLHAEFVEAGLDTRTIAVTLRDAGYHTVLVGKYLNGYPAPRPRTYVPPGWADWHARAGSRDMYTDHRISDNGTYRLSTAYSTDFYTDLAVRAVQATPAGKPLFLWLSYAAPHEPATPAERHRDALPTLEAPRDAAFDEADVSDKPAHIRDRPPLPAAVVDEVDARYRRMAQTGLAADEGVERVVDALAAAGRLANAYVVFASDNGFMHGQHRADQYKAFPYDEVARMILLVRGPGVRAGSVVRALVSNADLAPTFAGWAGTAMPPGVDGRSFAPHLAPGGAAAAGRRALPMAYTFGSAEENPIPGWTGIVTRSWKYVRHSTGEEEVYDRANDPLELSNLAGTAGRGLLAALRRRNAELQACAGAACRSLEDAPLR